jgi:hypothetical protein
MVMVPNFLKNKSKYFVPSIGHILFIAIFLHLSFFVGKGLLNDSDTGWHIRAGECILDTFSVPKQDMFSYLTPPLPWTAHEWLSEVVMALIHKTFGLTGIVIFFAFLLSLVYYLLFRMIQKSGVNIILNVLIVIMVAASSQLHWLARPHIFSLLLTVIWYFVLDAFEYRSRNYLYILPVIMLFWVNLHGGFIAGYILIGIYFLGNLIKFLFSHGVERVFYKKKTRVLSLTAIVCLLASLMNPYGYHILLFPVKLVSEKFIMDNIQEFVSPNFHEASAMPFKYLILLTIAILGIKRKELNLIELFLVLLFVNMAFFSVRHITLFAIIAAPILAKHAEPILKQVDGAFMAFFEKRSSNITSVDASAKGCLWLIGSLLIVAIALISGKIEYGFDKEKKPVAAVEFLKRVHLKGNMFNDDQFGGYLIYSAFPEYRVFFDGRSDMYGSSRLKEFLKIDHFEQGWERIIEKYKINWIFWGADTPLSRFLLGKNEWRLIYADKVANIFVKNVSENEDLIRQFGNAKPVVTEDKSVR